MGLLWDRLLSSGEPRWSALVAVSKRSQLRVLTRAQNGGAFSRMLQRCISFRPGSIPTRLYFSLFVCFLFCFLENFPPEAENLNYRPEGKSCTLTRCLRAERLPACCFFLVVVVVWRDKQISAVNGSRFRRCAHSNSSTGSVRGPLWKSSKRIFRHRTRRSRGAKLDELKARVTERALGHSGRIRVKRARWRTFGNRPTRLCRGRGAGRKKER